LLHHDGASFSRQVQYNTTLYNVYLATSRRSFLLKAGSIQYNTVQCIPCYTTLELPSQGRFNTIQHCTMYTLLQYNTVQCIPCYTMLELPSQGRLNTIQHCTAYTLLHHAGASFSRQVQYYRTLYSVYLARSRWSFLLKAGSIQYNTVQCIPC